MEFVSFQRYRAIVAGPVEINLDTPDVSFEVSYLTDSDVDKRKGGSLDELRHFNNDWEKAVWGNRGTQWGTAEVRPGTEVIVQYMSRGLFHILGSDSPDCNRIVGEANVKDLHDFRDLSAPPKYRPGRKLAQGATFSGN